MSIIQGAAVGFRTLVDGSARATLDFEPSEAAAAFALFGKPGQPVAVAALKDGHAAIQEPQEAPQTAALVHPPNPSAKSGAQMANWAALGPLCKEAIGYSDDPQFKEWIFEAQQGSWRGDTVEWIKAVCDVKSRKDLDKIDKCYTFISRVRVPFLRWLRERQTA